MEEKKQRKTYFLLNHLNGTNCCTTSQIIIIHTKIPPMWVLQCDTNDANSLYKKGLIWCWRFVSNPRRELTRSHAILMIYSPFIIIIYLLVVFFLVDYRSSACKYFVCVFSSSSFFFVLRKAIYNYPMRDTMMHFCSSTQTNLII